jgi:PKHD-type hydroxylase
MTSIYREPLLKSSTVKILYWKKLKNLLQNVNEMVIDCNYQNFGFDLNLLTDYQAVNYNSYSSKKNQKYDWHMDFDYKRPLLDTKLTLLINVSTKDYEGGEFQLNDGNVFTVSQFSKPGDMLLFRSHILHRVLPVTKGERKSLTMFFDGPKFR